MIRQLLLAIAMMSVIPAFAAPKAMKVVPLGKADAPVKGTFTRNAGAEPENLNPVNSQELVSANIQEYIVEGLLSKNAESDEWEPGIAESYEVSKDYLTYTFHLNKNAKFSDGTPITSEDVKFSIEYPKDPAFHATAKMPYYEHVQSVETPDPLTVVVKMNQRYFQNLDVLASGGYTPILPKHIYGDPKKKFEDHPIFGSGAYKVEKYNRGKNILLVRDSNYWGINLPANRGSAKFEHVNFRFIKDENLELEMIKKGDLDYMEPINPENYVQKATGEPFGTKIRKVEAENRRPKLWDFIGWNEKNPLFKDKNVRLALSYLINRKELIDKFYFNLAVEAIGPQYYKSPFNPPGLKPVEFNPEKAKQLLKQAGWEDKEKTGILQKTIDGKKVEFRFSLILARREVEKFFTLYKEELRKAGIDMEIKIVEWSTLSNLLNEQKFEAVTLRWGGGSIEDDLKQLWHSESARPGGSNFISYSNKEVDKLIDQARQEMDKNKRRVLWQKVTRLIADDQPYSFMFNQKYDLYLLNKKIAYDKPTYQYGLSYSTFYMAP